MKKKLIFLSILFMMIICISKVGAVTCTYYAIAGAHANHGTDYVDGTGLVKETYYRKATARLSLFRNKVKTSITYLSENDKYNTLSTEHLKNWSLNYDDSTTVGKDYALRQQCPELLVGLTSVWDENASSIDVWFAKEEDEAEKILENRVKKYFHNQAYLYIFTHNDQDKDYSLDHLSCNDFYTPTDKQNSENGCITNSSFSCMWVEKYGASYCNFDELIYVKCGGSWDIPEKLPGIVSFFVNLLKIATPIILIFVSIISLIKAISSTKDDEIKKAQTTLVRRLIAAVLVFFIIQITQFVILKVADSSEEGSINSCLSCFLNNDCSKNRYYKTNVLGDYQCTYLSDVTKHYDCDSEYKK